MDEYNRLYKIYVEKSDDELREIINPANGHTEISVEVAKDILCYERKVYDEESIKNLFSEERVGISRKINLKATLNGGIKNNNFIQQCGILLLLITIYPVGMYFLWKNKKFDKTFKVIESVSCLAVWVCLLYFLAGNINHTNESETYNQVVSQSETVFPDNFILATEEQMAQLQDTEGLVNIIKEALANICALGETSFSFGNYKNENNVIFLDAYGETPQLKKILISLQYTYSISKPGWILVSVKDAETDQYYYVMDELKKAFDLYNYTSGLLVSKKTENLKDIQNETAKVDESKKESASGTDHKANQTSNAKSSTNDSEKKNDQNQNKISESSDDMLVTEKTAALEVSNMFKDVYLPYAKREKSFVFEGVKTFAQNTNTYTAEIKEPDSEDACSIKFTDENGDYVYIAFSPNEDGVYTVILVSYYQASSNSEVSLSNYSAYSSPENDTFKTHRIGESDVVVKGTDEQQEFLFKK